MSTEIDIQFPADAEALLDVRHSLDGLADQIHTEEFENLRLVVNELATNSILHAGLDPKDWVQLRVSLTSKVVYGEVCDSGSGFETLPPPPKAGKSSGWGLYIVERVADRWGVEWAEPFCVWFEIDLAHGPPDRGNL
jgi:anti-sigma regulatory factor (Ser/Thr protein kinase)